MSGSPRQRIMRGVVLFVALWPFAHLGLVARYEIDPWEFFGWAMYSQPAARVQIRVDVERDGTRKGLRAMGALREAIREQARRRTALGRLASHDPLARRVLQSDPGIDAAWIVERRVYLDEETARLAGDERETLFIKR